MPVPLSTLLSQVLVAFTIEFDNEFERQMPHWTTNYRPPAGTRQGVWLVSMAMWTNCMQFVGEEGISVGELERLARTKTNLNGMERWGYTLRSAGLIRATPKGRMAQQVWGPLFGAIEERWRARFGKDEIQHLRESLWALVSRFDVDLPDCLPILGYGLFSIGPKHEQRPDQREDTGRGSQLTLPALLSRALLAFAIEFESESHLSLAICANVLRVLNESGARVRDLPSLTGVSKEAIAMAFGILQKMRLAVIEPDPAGGRAKVARLTSRGRKAQEAYRQLLGSIEERWQARFGEDTIRTLRKLLERLAAEVIPEPYPDGWRASAPKPATLPHYPMVLHRGGFPDGS